MEEEQIQNTQDLVEESPKQYILAFVGRAQSGKTTSCNFLCSLLLQSLQITERAWVDKLGRLCVSDLFGNRAYEGIMDMKSHHPDVIKFLDEYVHPFVKVYSFADPLKKSIAMDVLGLSYSDIYSIEGKNSLSMYKWEDMPGVLSQDKHVGLYDLAMEYVENYGENNSWEGLHINKSGFMTNREVMQYVGTQLFRKMRSSIWSDAVLKRIKEDGSALALIDDCRFLDETNSVRQAGGVAIRLTKNPKPEDTHESETEMDRGEYDFVIKNDKMSILEQCKKIYSKISDWKCLPEIS